MLVDKHHDGFVGRRHIGMGVSREIAVSPLEVALAAEEVDDLLVDVSAVVVAKVENQRILVIYFCVHLEKEVVEILVAHCAHMDVSDLVACLLLHDSGALLFPFLVLEGLDG